MTWIESVILGLVQGLTEFLPVSSSGHLVLGKHILGIEASEIGILFEVLVHFGTALSIIVVYRKELVKLIGGFITAAIRPSQYQQAWINNQEFRMALFILLTMIPTGLVYVLFKDDLEALFSDPKATSFMLIVTGILLLLTRLRKNPDGEITPIKALLIGVAQSVAMIPGISRSGSTICTAIYLNIDARKAADFSFLMLLPVVLGATLLKTGEVLSATSSVPWGILLLGTFVAFLSGIVAIKLVLNFVRSGKLHYFAFYCFAIGGTGIALL